MKKYIVICIAIAVIAFSFYRTEVLNVQKIAIILPLEHEAMNQIVNGFKKVLNKDVKVEVYNSQGSQPLLHSITKQLSQQNISLIVPIGAYTTQMVLGNEKQIPVLSLASTLTEEDRRLNNITNVTAVQDELATEKVLTFIKVLSLKSNKILIVHSSDGKIYKEIENIEKLATSYGLIFKKTLVNSIIDIQSLGTTLNDDIGAVFMLKDHMVVSNTNIIRRIANKQCIPLIASDEGSVKNGADLAIGVKEKDIGIKGGKIANLLLKGKNPRDVPFSSIDAISIFINSKIKFSKEEITNFSIAHDYKIIQIEE